VFELTELDSIENFALGVRIAIDDVGTGHGGLSHMLKLGVDIIKIDKMFVDAIGTDRNSTSKGVENFEQVMHPREVGIRSAQGYVFAPPL
jgi:EAL domain-containing protein (putative c-di-GMP-specific phosphodiesterase class I)